MKNQSVKNKKINSYSQINEKKKEVFQLIQNLKKSVAKAKTFYEKYESGKTNSNQFKSELQTLGFKNDDKISHLLRSGDYIKPSFTSI